MDIYQTNKSDQYDVNNTNFAMRNYLKYQFAQRMLANFRKERQAETQQKMFQENLKRKIENDTLLKALDTLYAANRAINGLTYGALDKYGQKLGFDTRMTDYVKLNNTLGTSNMVHDVNELGKYIGQTIGTLGLGYGIPLIYKYGPEIANNANMAYRGYQLGKGYDRLRQNPFQGNGTDVISSMKNKYGEPVVMQRGEAILDSAGNVKTHGNALMRATGTRRNFGMNKIIYKHDMPREDVTQIPRILKYREPSEISERNQHVYILPSKDGEMRLITTPKDGRRTISSMYIKELEK